MLLQLWEVRPGGIFQPRTLNEALRISFRTAVEMEAEAHHVLNDNLLRLQRIVKE